MDICTNILTYGLSHWLKCTPGESKSFFHPLYEMQISSPYSLVLIYYESEIFHRVPLSWQFITGTSMSSMSPEWPLVIGSSQLARNSSRCGTLQHISIQKVVQQLNHEHMTSKSKKMHRKCQLFVLSLSSCTKGLMGDSEAVFTLGTIVSDHA